MRGKGDAYGLMARTYAQLVPAQTLFVPQTLCPRQGLSRDKGIFCDLRAHSSGLIFPSRRLKILQNRVSHVENFLDISSGSRDRSQADTPYLSNATDPGPTTSATGASSVAPSPTLERPISSATRAKERAVESPSAVESSGVSSGTDSVGNRTETPTNGVETTTVAQKSDGLPPAAQAWALLQKYLVDFNRAIPLFEEEYLTALYRSALSGHQNVSSLQLTVVHLTLAIAHHLRAMNPLATPADNENAHTYLRQASVALPDILLSPPTLISAQCLIAMAVVINGTADSQPATILVTTALRMMLEIIRANSNFPESDIEGQRLKRVFWIALFTDVDASVRSGHWTSMTFYEPEIDLPLQQSADGLGLMPLGQTLFCIFHSRAHLAQIQIRLLQLLGVRNSLRNEAAIATSVEELAVDLTAWRLQEPLFQALPEAPLSSLHRSDVVHLLSLEASYFNTFFALESLREDIGPFNGSVLLHLSRYSSLKFSDYIAEARRVLRIFNRLAQGALAVAGLVIEAVTSALYIVLSFMIQYPSATTTEQDTELTTIPLKVIVELSQKDGQEKLVVALKTILLKVCERYNRHLRDPDSPLGSEDLSFITWATTAT